MPRPKRPPSPWLSLLGLLWRQPLYAVPFAIFFGTLNGASRAIYVLAYVVSLFFAYAIGLALWTLEHFVLPRLEDPEDRPSGKRMLGHVALYGGTSLIGAFAAAAALHFTGMPGFLRSAPHVVGIRMFTPPFSPL